MAKAENTKIRGLRLTLAEDADLVRRAEDAGLSVVDYVRRALTWYQSGRIAEALGADVVIPVRNTAEAAVLHRERNRARPEETIEPLCEHKWRNFGWGTVCEKCKVKR